MGLFLINWWMEKEPCNWFVKISFLMETLNKADLMVKASLKMLLRPLNSMAYGRIAQNQFRVFWNFILIKPFNKFSSLISSMEILRYITETAQFLEVSLTKRHYFHMEAVKWSTFQVIHMKENGLMENSKVWAPTYGKVGRNTMVIISMV